MKAEPLPGTAQQDANDLKAFVQGLPDDLFDGHTEFGALKPEQKLQWLSQCARFAWEIRKAQSAAPRQ